MWGVDWIDRSALWTYIFVGQILRMSVEAWDRYRSVGRTDSGSVLTLYTNSWSGFETDKGMAVR